MTNLRTRTAVFLLVAGWLIPANLFADAPGFIELPSVEGLRFQTNAGSVTLVWPSDPRESFAVLWRSNISIEVPWVTLTNSLPAADGANKTAFCDVGALARSQAMQTNADLSDFYRVYVIPDFWFNLEGVTLNGDAKDGGEDFLPFYYGTKKTDFFQPQVELLVDGRDDEVWGRTAIQHVNFGSRKAPRRAYASGFWFEHDRFANGEHTLQIRSLLTLNNFVGQWSWYLTVTNKSVHVWVTNDISFVGNPPFIGRSNMTTIAQSLEPRVNWKIDVYDMRGQWVISKRGRTTDGNIRWDWDLRDAHGRLRNTDADFVFHPYITIWPLDESSKGGQLLMRRNAPHFWSEKIFGGTRNQTPAKNNPPDKQVFSRPWEFFHD